MDAADAKSLNGTGKVGPGQALYVKDPKTDREYLVDGKGNLFWLGGPSVGDAATMQQLRSAVIGGTAKAQPVSQEWLRTLNARGIISFPKVNTVSPWKKFWKRSPLRVSPAERAQLREMNALDYQLYDRLLARRASLMPSPEARTA